MRGFWFQFLILLAALGLQAPAIVRAEGQVRAVSLQQMVRVEGPYACRIALKNSLFKLLGASATRVQIPSVRKMKAQKQPKLSEINKSLRQKRKALRAAHGKQQRSALRTAIRELSKLQEYSEICHTIRSIFNPPPTETATPTPTNTAVPTNTATPTNTPTPTFTPTPTPVSPECLSEPAHSDSLRLLSSNDGLQISVSKLSNGKDTFEARLGDRILRQSFAAERFYVLAQNGIAVDYTIESRCGGVDIHYRVENPASNESEVTLPDLLVEGLVFPNQSALRRLKTKDFGNLVPLASNHTDWDDGSYPQVYSPALVLTDPQYAIGSAILFPVLEYEQTILPTLQLETSGEAAGTFRQRYAWAREEGYPVEAMPPKQIAPGVVREYTISLRFARSQDWLATLAPYKAYFNSLYAAGRIPQEADLRPVRGVMLADRSCYDAQISPRAFCQDFHLHDQGWTGFVPGFISASRALGYERSMLMVPSGRYVGSSDASGFNFPPQFMDFDRLLESTSSALSQFGNDSFSLGFWWGRSTQIPVFGTEDVSWNPIALQVADPDNSSHVSFLTGQLSKALGFGASDIAMDYFVAMPLYKRYEWARTIRELAPEAVFVGEGQQADVMHTRVGNFHDPYHALGAIPSAPDVLSNYLNPRQAIWMQLSSSDLEGVDRAALQRFINWGYTPFVIYNHSQIDVRNLELRRSRCNDGLDNDGDGFVDFPFDQGCSSAEDDAEN